MSDTTATGVNRQIVGMLSVAAGVSVFSIQDAIIKGMSGDFPIHEIVFVRCVVAFPLLLVVTVGEARGWPKFQRLGLHLLRGFLLYFAFLLYYLSVAHLQLAQAVALFFMAPLLVAGLSGPILGERVRPQSWIAIAVGGLGVVVILRPGVGVLDWALLLPVVASFTYALSVLCSRRLGDTQSGAAMALSATLTYMLASAGTAVAVHGMTPAPGDDPSIRFLIEPWLWPGGRDLALMSVCGVIAATAFFLLGHGYRLAQASRAAPFEYASLPWGILWGYVFFGSLPDLPTLVGALIIVAGGLYALSLERGGAPPKTARVLLSDEDQP